jgi:hypothetical protein
MVGFWVVDRPHGAVKRGGHSEAALAALLFLVLSLQD